MKKIYIAAPVKQVRIRRIERNVHDRNVQEKGIQTIMKLCSSVITADTHDEVLIKSAIAVGYSNAMQEAEMIAKEELQELIDMIGTIGEDKLKEIDSMERNIIMRHIRKRVKA